jgi:hypothetical protein
MPGGGNEKLGAIHDKEATKILQLLDIVLAMGLQFAPARNAPAKV